MWFAWDGDLVRFSHTSTRQKYRNLTHEPRVAISVQDPDDPYRFLEVRGVVESIEPDAGGAFYKSLQERYGLSIPMTDVDVRVVVAVRPVSFVAVEGGLVVGPDRGGPT